MPLYLTPIVGNGTDANPFMPLWPEEPGQGWIDLRPDSTVAAGRGLLYLPTPSVDSRLDKLVDLPDEDVPAGVKNRLQNALGLTLGQTRFSEIVAELLTTHARTDDTRWKPLRPTVQGVMELWLGGLGRFHAWRQGSVGASFTETWPTNGTTISTGQDQPWNEDSNDVEVSTNALRFVTLSAVCFGRCLTNLATDAHKHSATAALVSIADGARAGVSVRKIDSTTRTYYITTAERNSGAGGHARRLVKRVAGVQTILVNDVGTDPGSPVVIECQANGSSISGTVGSFALGPITDTAITGNLQVGYELFGATAGDTTLDGHTAADLAGEAVLLGHGPLLAGLRNRLIQHV